MPDPAEQLQKLYVAGFELEMFERYPKAVGVVRGECIALLVPGVDGMQMLGTPGWKIGSELGVLTTIDNEPVFQFKDKRVAATPERREALRQFKEDLLRVMRE